MRVPCWETPLINGWIQWIHTGEQIWHYGGTDLIIIIINIIRTTALLRVCMRNHAQWPKLTNPPKKTHWCQERAIAHTSGKYDACSEPLLQAWLAGQTSQSQTSRGLANTGHTQENAPVGVPCLPLLTMAKDPKQLVDFLRWNCSLTWGRHMWSYNGPYHCGIKSAGPTVVCPPMGA